MNIGRALIPLVVESGIPEEDVWLEPLHADTVLGTGPFVVIDVKDIKPESRWDGRTTPDGLTSTIRMEATVYVAFNNDGRFENASRFSTMLQARVFEKLTKPAGIDVVSTFKVYEAKAEYKPEIKHDVSAVALTVGYWAYNRIADGHVESVRIDIDHEPPSPPITERVDIPPRDPDAI